MNLPDTASLDLGQRQVILKLRRSNRARVYALRLDPACAIELVVPRRASLAGALRFAAQHAGWIEQRLATLPRPLEIGDGAILPLLGMPHQVRHAPAGRRAVERVLREDGGAELVVGGEAPHLPRRVKDWLRGEARRVIAPIVYEKAARLDHRIKRLSIRDSRTRWGSCSASGALAFSWRLVLTPQHIIDYVAAHEAAHLVELNHGPRFWQRCAELASNDIAPSRAWLRKNGGAILAIG